MLFRTIHDATLMLDRESEGREQSPTAAVVDSQSFKAPAVEKRGFDAGKKVAFPFEQDRQPATAEATTLVGDLAHPFGDSQDFRVRVGD